MIATLFCYFFGLYCHAIGATIAFPITGGTGTSTAPTTNSILIGNSGGVYDVKTLTQGSNITITNSGQTVTIAASGATSPYEIATTTNIAVPQLAYITQASGRTTLGSVATTTTTLSSEFTHSGTFGKLVGGADGTLSLTTNGVALTKIAQIAANSVLGNVTGSTGNVTALATSTIASGTGISVSGSGSLIAGSGVTITNSGVTSAVAGTGIGVSGATGAVTITNNGVTSNVAGTGINVSGATGAVTITNSSPLSGLTTTFPLSFSGTALSWIGLATTSQPTAGQLLYSNGSNGLTPVSTSSASCSSGVSCSSFTVVGTVAPSITNSGVTSNVAGDGISVSGATGAVTISNSGKYTIATSSLGISQLWYTTATSPTTVANVATSTATCTSASGVSCTNFSIVGAGGTTIALSSIPNSSLSNSTISGIALGSNLANLSATDTTLTFSGTYNGGTARTVGINLGNANTWTALQQFSLASSTQLSAYRGYFGATATTTIDTAGNVVIPSGATLTNTGKSDGCASWSSGVLTSLGTACGSGGSSAFEIATTTDIAVPNVAYFTQTSGRTTLGSVATGTISSANSALTVTGSRYTLGGSTTFTVSTTSTNMFVGTPGQVLSYGTATGWTGVATTTFSTGLTYTGATNAVTVNTSQNIATLSNLTSNGIVFTSGGGGTLNVGAFTANTIPYVNGAGTGLAFTATSSLNLGIAGGGTNATACANTNGVWYYDGTRFVCNANTTTGTILIGNNAAPSFTATPTIGTSVTVPLVIGGTAVGSSLEFRATSGAGVGAEFTKFSIGNNGAIEFGRIQENGFGIGTTSPRWNLTISSSTRPQLALTDGSLTNNPWTFRSAGGFLYIATSSASTFATTTLGFEGFRLDTDNRVTLKKSLSITNIGQSATTTYASGLFDKTFKAASTTPSDDSSSSWSTGSTATSTFKVWNPSRPVRLVSFYCKTNGNTLLVELGTGSASSTVGFTVCTPTGTASTTITKNIDFPINNDIYVSFGSATTTTKVNNVTFTTTWTEQKD